MGGNFPDLSTTLRVPTATVVLGGIEGIISNFQNGSETVKIDALKKALDYGEAGLDLVIQALKDPLPRVQVKAYNLLKNKTEKEALKAIKNFNHFSLFECLRTLESHSYGVHCLAISSLGNHIISDNCDKTIKVWDINTGEYLRTLYGY